MRRKNSRDTRNKGISLLEVLVAIVVVSLIGLAAVALLNARSTALEDNNTVQEGQASAEEALSALSAAARALPEGGSFNSLGDYNLQLLPCQPESCDLVLTPDAAAHLRTSPARGYPYPPCPGGSCAPAPPAGHEIAFVRRWRVETVTGDYRLRKIIVAVLKDAQSTQPLVLQEMVVAVDR